MRSPGESHPQDPLTTVRETLASYGSQRSVDTLIVPNSLVPTAPPVRQARRSAKCRPEQSHQRPFGPAPLQSLHPYYERFCPCAPHRYSGARGVLHLALLPSHRDDRFSRSSSKPDPHSRRLYAGHQWDSTGHAPTPAPETSLPPRFGHQLRHLDTSSAGSL